MILHPKNLSKTAVNYFLMRQKQVLHEKIRRLKSKNLQDLEVCRKNATTANALKTDGWNTRFPLGSFGLFSGGD